MSHSSKRYSYIFKTVILGDGGVGKTSLRNRFLGKGFQTSYMETAGADFSLYETKAELKGGNVANVKVQIWDLAGQKRFKDIRASFYNGTRGALLVYDCTRPDTASSLDNWIEELQSNTNLNVEIVLVSNKIDLRNELPDSLTHKDGMKIAKSLSNNSNSSQPINYIETSAKDNTNVPEAFNKLIMNLVVQVQNRPS